MTIGLGYGFRNKIAAVEQIYILYAIGAWMYHNTSL